MTGARAWPSLETSRCGASFKEQHSEECQCIERIGRAVTVEHCSCLSQSIGVKAAQLAMDVALLCNALAFAVAEFAEEAGDCYPSHAACL